MSKKRKRTFKERRLSEEREQLIRGRNVAWDKNNLKAVMDFTERLCKLDQLGGFNPVTQQQPTVAVQVGVQQSLSYFDPMFEKASRVKFDVLTRAEEALSRLEAHRKELPASSNDVSTGVEQPAVQPSTTEN